MVNLFSSTCCFGKSAYPKLAKYLAGLGQLPTNRCFFAWLLIGISSLAAQPPSWLPEVIVQDSSDSPNAESTSLDAVPNFDSLEELKHYQSDMLARWSAFLGAFEHRKTSQTSIRWKETVAQADGLSRSLIEYETEQGQWTEAFVLRPAHKDVQQMLPGAVVFHSTVDNSLFQPVGLAGPNSNQAASQDALRKAYALHLARRGYVTVSPRNYLWPTSIEIAAGREAEKFKQRHPHRKGMARMLLDSLCAVDVLLSLEGVDPQRIGAIGHSLGAKEVLYLAAFDTRIKATVSSEGGIGIQQSNWDAPWYLGVDCLQADFELNHHQLLAAVAPRAFLLIGGEASDGQASLSYLRQALRAYRTMGVPERLGFYNHRQGHQVTDESLERSLQWIDWHLRR